MTSLTGKVVRGDGRGRQLGFPTANIDYGASPLPENGVYEVSVEGDGLSARGVCNVGLRPTISGSKGVHVEVHIPGFSGDLYGQVLKVAFKKKIRGEKKFASLDELKAQIRTDIESLDKRDQTR
jgi:riboflavin kinase/FMN adenylyltransferase